MSLIVFDRQAMEQHHARTEALLGGQKSDAQTRRSEAQSELAAAQLELAMAEQQLAAAEHALSAAMAMPPFWR